MLAPSYCVLDEGLVRCRLLLMLQLTVDFRYPATKLKVPPHWYTLSYRGLDRSTALVRLRGYSISSKLIAFKF
jgi:hypothetical protein